MTPQIYDAIWTTAATLAAFVIMLFIGSHPANKENPPESGGAILGVAIAVFMIAVVGICAMHSTWREVFWPTKPNVEGRR